VPCASASRDGPTCGSIVPLDTAQFPENPRATWLTSSAGRDRCQSSVAKVVLGLPRELFRQSPAVMRRTSSAFLLLESEMSLVDSTVVTGRERGGRRDRHAAMPGIADRCCGADDEHVAAVAIGDDLPLHTWTCRAPAGTTEADSAPLAAAGAIADARERRLALSATSPDGSIFFRTSAISP